MSIYIIIVGYYEFLTYTTWGGNYFVPDFQGTQGIF